MIEYIFFFVLMGANVAVVLYLIFRVKDKDLDSFMSPSCRRNHHRGHQNVF